MLPHLDGKREVVQAMTDRNGNDKFINDTTKCFVLPKSIMKKF